MPECQWLVRRTAVCHPVILTVATMLLSACSSRTPPIGQRLPLGFGETGQFDVRVQQRFPIGSPEEALVAELRREEFSIRELHGQSTPCQFAATYDVHGFACRHSWTIEWTAVRGKLTEIQGMSRQICL